MREVELLVGRGNVWHWTLSSIGLDYVDVAYSRNYILFYQLHISKVCSILRFLGWYMKGLPWNSIFPGFNYSFILFLF